MSFNSLVKSRIAAHLVSDARLERQRQAVERRRKRDGAPHRIDYFHDVSDPYCHLTAQVLQELVSRYEIVLRPHIISGAPDWAMPARASLQDYSVKDAALLAKKAKLSFKIAMSDLSTERIKQTQSLLAAALDNADFPQIATEIGEAFWNGSDLPDRARFSASEQLAEGDALLNRLGHYLGATFHYGGEWYWGIDRLHHLEMRLQRLGAERPGASPEMIFAPPLINASSDGKSGKVVEAFISLRSPYSYLAYDRARRMSECYGAEFQTRHVLPMVMRGLAVPRRKAMYILLDTAREARRLGIPFGRICDPLGKAVERGYALIDHARDEGCLENFISSFMRGVWSEGLDAGTDRGLAKITERAGLDWRRAKPLLGNEAWREEVEENQQELSRIGLWGVPSFRCGETVIWGQDRLWVLEEALAG